MHITSKSRYALKVMLDVAAHHGQGVVTRKDISQRQGVTLEYLDQILIRLRRAQLLESVRGPRGGYRLLREVETISIWDIFAAVEDSLYPVGCVSPESLCDFQGACDAQGAWEKIFAAVHAPLSQMFLSEFVDQNRSAPAIPPKSMVCCAGGAVHG